MNKMIDIDIKSAVCFTVKEIEYICKNLKKRAPGSDGEKEAAEYMAQILETKCGVDNPLIESFSEHPSAFYGYFRISSFFDVMTFAGYFIHPILSIVSAFIALFLFIFQFMMYKEIIDPFFPLKKGTNVTGIRKCSGEIKNRVFINGHIDAAWEFPLNNLFGGVIFEIPGAMALIGVITLMIFSFSSLLGALWVDKIIPYTAVFVPFFILVAFTYNPRIIVDGANDNLTGCFIGLSLLHEMEKSGIDLEHTELGVILTGSEEAGLKGAKAWAEKHRDEYTDVPTFILTFDTIHDPKFLAVNTRDLNGTVKSDMKLSHALLMAADNKSIPLKEDWVPPFGGATDSAAFTEYGFRSIGITGLNHKLEDYYHTRRDSFDNLNEEGLSNGLTVVTEFISMLDHGELEL